MKPVQKAMMYKDLKEVTGSKQMLIPMIVVPLLFVLVLPIAILATAGAESADLGDLQPLMELMGPVDAFDTDAQLLIHLVLNYMFPPFFLLIPIMTSSILGASSFVGEKERKTLETLLYTPMSIGELFGAKVLSTFVPAYAITLVSFLVFGVVVNVGAWPFFGELIFPNLKWMITVFWLSPALAMLGMTFMVIVSARAKTFQDAQQMSALIVVPVIALIIGQTTGLFLLSEAVLVAAGGAVAVLDFLLIRVAARKFTPEELI